MPDRDLKLDRAGKNRVTQTLFLPCLDVQGDRQQRPSEWLRGQVRALFATGSRPRGAGKHNHTDTEAVKGCSSRERVKEAGVKEESDSPLLLLSRELALLARINGMASAIEQSLPPLGRDDQEQFWGRDEGMESLWETAGLLGRWRPNVETRVLHCLEASATASEEGKQMESLQRGLLVGSLCFDFLFFDSVWAHFSFHRQKTHLLALFLVPRSQLWFPLSKPGGGAEAHGMASRRVFEDPRPPAAPLGWRGAHSGLSGSFAALLEGIFWAFLYLLCPLVRLQCSAYTNTRT